MTEQTPEARRDDAITAVHEAGGTVTGSTPLAHPDSPETIAAYRLSIIWSTPALRDAADGVRADVEIEDADLVPWIDPTVIEEVEE